MCRNGVCRGCGGAEPPKRTSLLGPWLFAVLLGQAVGLAVAEALPPFPPGWWAGAYAFALTVGSGALGAVGYLVLKSAREDRG